MRKPILAGAIALAMISNVSAHDLDIVNKSKTSIHHFYLSTVKEKNWGPDQLGDRSKDVIAPGQTFTLTDIERGHYDVKLIAEDDTECVIENVSFNQDKEWVVTERMLDKCGSGD